MTFCIKLRFNGRFLTLALVALFTQPPETEQKSGTEKKIDFELEFFVA